MSKLIYLIMQQKLVILILQILLKKNKYEKDGRDFEDKINKIDKRIPDDTSLAKKKLILK